MQWINFLHLYQPPGQPRGFIRRVTQESYRWILQELQRVPNARMTINLTGSLTEQLIKFKQDDILKGFKRLVEREQIELTGTAMYHPILPLLPPEEVLRQIQLNDALHRTVFGRAWKPKGFYLPEMAYSRSVASLLSTLKVQWIILDEIAFPDGVPDPNIQYRIRGLPLQVVFRHRMLSSDYVPRVLLDLLDAPNGLTNLITATDGEMYGHHHKDTSRHFEQTLADKRLALQTISSYLQTRSSQKVVTPRASSWVSTTPYLRKNIPYQFWDNPQNPIHQHTWLLTQLAIRAIKHHRKDPGWESARHHLDQGLASCTFWWSAGMRPVATSPITWNPDEVERGINALIRSIRSFNHLPPAQRLRAEKCYLLIKELIWKKHWTYYWKYHIH
ncbi:MAG: hypothetical protein AAB733_03170 [Patescibacteria group bacterium]